MIGDHGHEDGAAEDRADRVSALRNGDEHERGNEEAVVHEAERCDCQTPCRDSEEHRDSVMLHALRPSRRERGDERSDARRGEQESEPLGADREHTVGVERKERSRRAEERREEVQQHGPEQDSVRAEVREPFDERAPDRQMDPFLARRRDQRYHGDDRDDERRDIDPVRTRETEGEDHEPGEGRTGDGRGLKENLVQGHRGRQLVALHEARREGAAGGPVEGGEGSTDGGERVQVEHVREPELRSDRESGGARREADLRDDEKAPPVDSIRDDAAEERQRYQRDRLEETNEPDIQGRAGDQVDLVRDRDETNLRAGQRDELPKPEQPERARLAERREVDQSRRA